MLEKYPIYMQFACGHFADRVTSFQEHDTNFSQKIMGIFTLRSVYKKLTSTAPKLTQYTKRECM